MPYWGMWPNSSGNLFPGYLVRSITNHSTGKWYYEMVFVVAAYIGQVGVGVDNDVESLSNAAGQVGSICWLGSGNVNYNANLNAYSASPYLIGTILGVAVDLTDAKIWFYNGINWNNSGSANPATNTGGFSISAVVPNVYALAQLSQVGDDVSANFTGTPAFTYGLPSGFSAWG